MKFYNRKNELEELEILSKAAERKAVMCVITGIRRVGKTELIKEFFKKERGLYFFVDASKTSTQLLTEFSTELKENLGLSERVHISSWDEFFHDLFTYAKKNKVIIAFDEFQRFSHTEKNLPFILQKHFDLHKHTSKLFVIISGSSFGLLRKMFIEEHAPLFQRPSNILHLRQFNFNIICRILHDLRVKDFIDKIVFYAIFGGIPKYYDLLDTYTLKDPDNAMKRLLFHELAPLKREIKNIMVEEFGKEVTTYYSILSAIALGKNKANEIADYSEVKETSLSPYLYDLSELLGAVKKELPVTEDIRSKRVRYHLNNNFFKFWFNFVYRKRSEFELGRFDHLMKLFKQEKNSFVGLAFEDVCRQYLLKTMKFDKIGRWWSKGKDNNIEIDLIALDEKNDVAIFAECKWRDKKPTIADLEKLKEKATFVKWRATTRSEKFVFFSKSGFDNNILDYAKQHDYLLIDLIKMEKEFMK